MTLTIFIGSLIYVLIREFLFVKERNKWDIERQKLIDRIQARDLPEYKTFEEPKQVKEKEPKEEIIFV